MTNFVFKGLIVIPPGVTIDGTIAESGPVLIRPNFGEEAVNRRNREGDKPRLFGIGKARRARHANVALYAGGDLIWQEPRSGGSLSDSPQDLDRDLPVGIGLHRHFVSRLAKAYLHHVIALLACLKAHLARSHPARQDAAAGGATGAKRRPAAGHQPWEGKEQ